MKKVINLKEVLVILLSVVLITVLSTSVSASGLVLGNESTTVTGNEYENAQTVPEDNNLTTETPNTTGNETEQNVTIDDTEENNTARTYNTNNNSDDLPQTGIEDYNVGILLVICIASAIFAYKKIHDYKNV